MSLSVTGGFNIGGTGAATATFRTTAYQIGDDVNFVRGTHQTALGLSLAHWRTNQFAPFVSTGSYSFIGSATGLGMSDFLTGSLSNLQHGADTYFSTRQNYVGLYATDLWKVTP